MPVWIRVQSFHICYQYWVRILNSGQNTAQRSSPEHKQYERYFQVFMQALTLFSGCKVPLQYISARRWFLSTSNALAFAGILDMAAVSSRVFRWRNDLLQSSHCYKGDYLDFYHSWYHCRFLQLAKCEQLYANTFFEIVRMSSLVSISWSIATIFIREALWTQMTFLPSLKQTRLPVFECCVHIHIIKIKSQPWIGVSTSRCFSILYFEGYRKKFFDYMELFSRFNYHWLQKDRPLLLPGSEYLFLFHTINLTDINWNTDLWYLFNFRIWKIYHIHSYTQIEGLYTYWLIRTEPLSRSCKGALLSEWHWVVGNAEDE